MESELNATTLILLFTLYYFVERVLRVLLRRSAPEFYTSLRASRKDGVFLALAMGLLISVFSTPSCARAALASLTSLPPSTTSAPQVAFVLSPDAQTCLSTRAILWISELPRLDLYPLYVAHHAGALLALLSLLTRHWHPAPLLLVLATLVSEVPGDALWLLSAYIDFDVDSPAGPSVCEGKGKTRTLQTAKYHLTLFNTAQYTLLRSASLVSLVFLLIHHPALRPTPGLTYESAYAYMLVGLYAGFCAAYVARQVRSIAAYRRARALERMRAGSVEVDTEKAHLP
ncbi:hypothetical protein MKEN_00484600 [Mycena kentingensis (nom. inval.)]|nr:hypothetical protein MKEN_00484600 [Mycena kentingensis (nom. inval.)]